MILCSWFGLLVWCGLGAGCVMRKFASCCVDLLGMFGCFVLLVALHLFCCGTWLIVMFLNIALFGCYLLVVSRGL